MSSIINDCNTYININITMIEEEDQRYNGNNQNEPIIIKKGIDVNEHEQHYT